MRTSLFGFLALLTIGIVTATDGPKEEMDSRLLPVRQPEHSTDGKSKDLLSTLQELHHSLIAQIATLEATMKTSKESSDQSETTHLLQHYTAQKNNIEREIALIQSIEASPKETTAPRHISKYVSSAEEKSVPSLLNIFRKNRVPNNVDEPNNDIGYSLPYPPYYYPGYGPYPYPYNGPPPKPNYPYPEDLIESTFPGFPRPPQTFIRAQPPQDYQTSVQMEPRLQVPSQYPSQPQVLLQPDVPPSPWIQNTQSKPEVEPPFGPPRPQLNQQEDISEEDIQKSQESASQYGQKQGVFIYYPNAVITQNEEPERPSIVDRFGQAIDRFGQAISNLANRQPSRIPVLGSTGTGTQKSENSPSRIRISRPRSSSNQKVKDEKEITMEDKKPTASSDEKVMTKNPENKKSKLRWVST